MASSDSVDAVRQELSSTQTRVLGFEGVSGSGGDWLATGVKLQSGTPHIEGAKSAAFAVTASSATISSIPLSSLGPITNQVKLSVWLPAYLAGLSYQGQVGLRLNSPTAGIYSQYYGPVRFTNGSPTGTWQQITFTLPAADVSALSTRTYHDLVATIDLGFSPNPAYNPNNPFAVPGHVDALTFGTGGSGSGGAGGSSGGGGKAGAAAGASGSGGRGGTSGMSGAGGSAGRAGGAGAGGSAAAAGPCVFSPPPASTPNTAFTFSIQLPRGVPRESVALSTAGGSLTLDDGVQVVKDGGGFASVSSVGATNRTSLGVSARVQNAYSEPLGMDLRSSAHVYGLLKTAADLTKQAGAGVDGVVSQFTSLKPLDLISWPVLFPSLNRGTCNIEPDNAQTIEPGSYGNIAVKSRSHLKLRSGTYFFGSLSLDPQAILDVDNTTGPVFIYVKNSFTFSGSTVELDPSRTNILFGVASATPIAIQSAFRGILVAPQAAVALPTEMTSGHVGSFFAKSLILHQHTLIHHQPLAPAEFCAAGEACSTFCPCVDGGSCSADNQCQNGHSCSSGKCTCVASCTGKTCGEGNGCGQTCPGTCGTGDICTNSSECAAGSKCTGQGPSGALICEPVGAHCSNGVKDRDESDVDCGGADCPLCTHGKLCNDVVDCVAGDECGTNNSACFGLARGKRVCWPTQCGNASTGGNAYDCGSNNSLCGKSCTCGGCDHNDPNAVCPAGEVCKEHLGQVVGATTTDACVDPRCPSNDPALCGPGSLCGDCVCTPNCAAATCQNPSDGCNGICPGVCGPGGGSGGGGPCQDDITCGVGFSCIAGPNGVSSCRPSSCAFKICGQAGPECGDLCPSCTPHCDGRQCGPDPHCGQDCGSCGDGTFCGVAGNCVTATPPPEITVPDGDGGSKVLPPLPDSPTNPVGALSGQFSVSDQGSPVYNIPIEVPPGRAGMEPALSLQYSGSRANGEVGVGWHLQGLSKITRCPRSYALDGVTGPVRNDSTDRFCIDGKRLESISGKYGEEGTEYRTLIDSFAKVVSRVDALPMIQVDPLGKIVPVPRGEQGPDSFVVWTKDGRKLTYGGSYDSTVLAHTAVRYAWLLNRVEDRAGNTMVVSYSNLPMAMPESETVAPNSVVLPRAIAYTGHAGSPEIDGKREVYFEYEARTDPQLRFTQGGAPFVAAQRLSRITTFVDHQPVKNYHLQYVPGDLSQVQKIFECAGGDDSHCKAPTTFEYARSKGFAHDEVGINLSAAGQLDMNGDGLPDFMATNLVVGGVPAQPTLKAAQVVSDIAIGAAAIALDAYVGPAAGFALSITWSIIKGPFFGLFAKKPTIKFEHALYTATGQRGSATFSTVPDVQGLRCGNDKEHPAFLLDYDQDGLDDVVTACGANNGALYVARSLGNGNFESLPKDNSPVVTVPIGLDQPSNPRQIAPRELAGPILIDVNGDGLQDIVSCPDPYTVELRLRLAPPAAFETVPISLATLIPPPPQGHNPGTPRATQRLCGHSRPTYNSMDLDGDGTPDLLVYGEGGWHALRLSYPAGKATLSWQAVPMPVTGQSDGGKNLNLGDFNGDGLADVFGFDDKQYTVWLNTGGGRFYSKTIARPDPRIPPSRDYHGNSVKFNFGRVAVLDYNTDGREDFLEHWGTASYYQGSGTSGRDYFNWTLEPSGKLDFFSTEPVPSIKWPHVDQKYYPATFTISADVDGDGHLDLLGGNSAVFYGSGDVSLSKITDGLGKVLEIQYGTAQGAGGYKPDERCAGGSTPGNTWPEKCLPKMSSLVAGHIEKRLDSAAGGGAVPERYYTYTFVNGRMNLTGHGWLGFDRRIIHAVSAAPGDGGTTTTIDYEPVVRYTPSGQVATDLGKPYLYPFAGLPRTTTVDQHISTVAVDSPPLQNGFYERRTQTVNRWQAQQSAFSRPFPVVTLKTTSTFDRPVQGGPFGGPPAPFDFNGTELGHCDATLASDGYGNLSDEDSRCYAGSTSVESVQTHTEFAPDPLSWLISNPEHIKISKYRNGFAQREYRLSYSRGLLESVTRAPEASNDQWHRSTYVRDDFGNIKQIIEATKADPVRTTDITYDRDGMFPSTVTNAAAHTTKISFDPRWGSPERIVDANGIAVLFGHDGFGRVTQRHGPEGTALSTYSTIYFPNRTTKVGSIDPKIQVQVERRGLDGSVDGATTTEYDCYGRVVRTISEGFAASKVIQERVYDELGRVSGTTLPHTAELQAVPYDRYSYHDNLKRLTRVDHSDGSFKEIQYATWASIKEQYFPWFQDYVCNGEDASGCAINVTRTIDEKLRDNVVFTDHVGDLVRNIDGENTSNTLHTSNYVHGPFGELVRARDNRNLATRFAYDDYGRLLTQTDPDTGDSVYTYNGFDELRTSTDPKHQLRTYNHDSLGRVESIVDDAGLSQWIYDQGPNALGRLSESISPATSNNPSGQRIHYSYESATPARNRGYLASVTYTIDSDPYAIHLEYDDLGRTSRIHYPTSGTGQPIVARYQYDPSGVLTGLDEVGSGSAHSLWRVNDVFQGHLVEKETLGNGSAAAQTSYRYHEARRWLQHVETTLGTEKIQTLDYTHDANGLVHSLAAKGSAPREYQYDNLNRLAAEITSTPGLPPTSTPYNYDEIGNLIGRGATTNTYRSSQPHLLHQAGNNTYHYDANGNVSERTGPNIPGERQIIAYTPFDLPRAISTPNSNELFDNVFFDYSADEERVARRDAVDGTTRHFVADLYQRKFDSSGTTQEERFRLYAGDRQIAELIRKDNADQTLYFHPDHLGSPETISDSNGAAYQQHFDPFGAPLDASNPELTRVGFTGHDHDRDLGLIDMKGRVYDPLAGRFLTADPVMQAPYWSQGLNRYSYVFNNPINNT
ncbi:MAG TPA: FG-GAP-like repeat-containing protein, partial [Polyangiaceae bacterium]|nr:FG-GAP-like repeat-containing protein [Polyangiaceae bacterium]